MDIKNNLFKILNGMSIGIVVSLIPSAIAGNLAKALALNDIANIVTITTSFMCLLIGLCIALQFKLDAISSGSLAVATMFAGGAIKGLNSEGVIQIAGTGDVINAAIGASIALIIIHLLGNRLKAYKLIVLPVVVVVITALITSYTAYPVGLITKTIGNIIAEFTTLQPYIMSVLIAISFGFIIVSPISTVAVALLINLSGNGSAAANIGVIGVAITLAFLSYKANGLGTSLAHILGSAKIQMANFIKAPIMLVPGLVSSAISAIFVPIFNIQGTPMSAGFGLSGLIGPLGHLGIVGFSTANIIISLLVFIIIPTIVSFLIAYLFKDKLKIVNDNHYKLDL